MAQRRPSDDDGVPEMRVCNLFRSHNIALRAATMNLIHFVHCSLLLSMHLSPSFALCPSLGFPRYRKPALCFFLIGFSTTLCE